MTKRLKIGVILEDTTSGQFTKIVSIRNGVYGIGGWVNRKAAEKQDYATAYMNARAVALNESIKVHGASSKAAPAKDETPAAAPKRTRAAKSTIAKPAVKKAAKKAQAAQKPAKKTTRKSK